MTGLELLIKEVDVKDVGDYIYEVRIEGKNGQVITFPVRQEVITSENIIVWEDGEPLEMKTKQELIDIINKIHGKTKTKK